MITVGNNMHVVDVRLYGKCEQNGTPSPTSPVDIVCNNGAIKVNSQGQIYADGIVETIQSSEKNMFNQNAVYSNKTKFTISNGIISGSSSSFNQTSYYIPQELIGKQLTFSAYLKKEGSVTAARVMFKGNTVINGNNIINTQNFERSYCSFIPTSTNDYIRISYGYNLGTIYAKDIQLEEGSVATPYEPYEGNSASAEMLLSVGNYKDVQSLANGVVKRNVGVKVLDGTENIVKQNFASTHYRMALKLDNYKLPLNKPGRTSIICNYFERSEVPLGTPGDAYPSYGICGFENRDFIYIYSIDYDNADSTAADFKQWLADQYAAGTPVIIAYPLAEPKIEKVTPQQITGTTIVQTAGSIQNMPMEVSRKNELVKRYVTDSNGVARAVRKVYIGSNLVFEDKYVDFVDLGLPSGLLWAKGNIVKNGSTYSIGNETDYGCYFMWGDTEGHNSDEGYNFSQDNYNAKGLNSISADLTLSQDAAHVLLGGDLRMPTAANFQELFDNTDTEWVTINGVNGRKFMKKSSHNVYVFLPAGGVYNGASPTNYNMTGIFWSASLNNSNMRAYRMNFGQSNVYPNDSSNKYLGGSIRAVQVRQ